MNLLAELVRARASMAGEAMQCVVAVLVVAWALRRERLAGPARRLADAAIWCGAGLALLLVLREAYGQVRDPRPWDFPTFHTVAVAAARGLDFYDPAVLTAVQAETSARTGVSSEWLSEVGYWYLPPSALPLLPLGLLDLRPALAVHLALQSLWLFLALLMLHRALPLRSGATGFAALTLMALLFQPVRATFEVAQIVFGCMLGATMGMVCLRRSPAAAGVGLAFGFLSKHLLLVPMALLTASGVRRERAAGAFAIGAVLVMVAVAMMVFGPDSLRGFLAHGAGARDPELARDPVVQSLLALLYRGLDATPRGGLLQVIAWPPFLVPATVLTTVTLWLAARHPEAGAVRSGLVLALTLLCYPNTLISTLALLLPVLLAVIHEARRQGRAAVPTLACVAVVFALPGLAGSHGGWSALVAWAACAALIPGTTRAQAEVPPGP